MRITLAMAVACLLAGISIADEAHSAIKQDTTIPAQGLGSALKQLANERDIQLVYRSEVVGERHTTGAVGELTFDEALTNLLKGTGLTYQYLDDRAVTIVPMGSSSAQASGPNTQAPSNGVWGRFRIAQAEKGSLHPNASSVEDIPRRVTLEEIIVTAQKRKESLQDVPISISVMNGQELDRSTAEGAGEMLNRIPGVVMDFSNQGGISPGNQVAIRGVGAPGSFASGPSTTGYYMDSVPFGLVRQALVPDANLYDLARIEVLRGPQGTLYGASSPAGVVRILTHDADLEKLQFKGRVVGSQTLYGGENGQADMAVNVPIVEGKLAARAVVGYQDLSGWIDRPTRKDANDQQQFNARVKLDSTLTERLSVGVSAWTSRTDEGAPSSANDGEGRSSTRADLESRSQDFEIYGAKINYDFPAASLSSVTSYIDFTSQSNLADGTGALPFLLTELSARTLAQEFNLVSMREGAWRWTAGAMYRDSEDKQFQDLYALAYPALVVYTSESWAVFGELTRLFFGGKLELTAGVRHFNDKVGQQHRSNMSNDPPPIGLGPDAEDTFDKTTPRVVLNWHPSEQATLYASYAEGFRSGLQQNPVVRRAVPTIPLTQPDLLKNYEVGSKGTFLDGRIEYDAAVYYMDWEDVQLGLVIDVEGVGRSVLINGASASGTGVDFALNTMLLEGLELGLNFSWNNLEVDEDVYTFVAGANRVLYPEGVRLNGSIETTAGASASYTFPLGGSGLEGTFSASANYRTESGVTVLNFALQPVVLQSDPILTSRAAFSVNSSTRWSASLFVDNLNNEQDRAYGGISLVPSVVDTYYLRPRTIGLQLEYRFE